MNFRGSCHCGAVAFAVDGEIESAMACNCSSCSAAPEDATRVYTFNKHLLKHRFCPVCGIHPYAEGTDSKGNAMAAINVRCLEEIDLAAIPVTHFDGRAR